MAAEVIVRIGQVDGTVFEVEVDGERVGADLVITKGEQVHRFRAPDDNVARQWIGKARTDWNKFLADRNPKSISTPVSAQVSTTSRVRKTPTRSTKGAESATRRE